MKKCNMCGSQLQDSYNVCPNCGNPNLAFINSMPNQSFVSNSQQKGNFGWAILGFFVPVAGLVLYLVWRNEKPGDAKMAGIGALISAILEAIFVVIYIIFFIYMMSQVGF